MYLALVGDRKVIQPQNLCMNYLLMELYTLPPLLSSLRRPLSVKDMLGKGKCRFCIAPRRENLISKALSVDHTVLPANTPHLPVPRSSPEGATTE